MGRSTMGAADCTGFTTRQVHAGEGSGGATPRATPIYLTAGFSFGEYGDAAAHFGNGEGYAYTRIGNPTVVAGGPAEDAPAVSATR